VSNQQPKAPKAPQPPTPPVPEHIQRQKDQALVDPFLTGAETTDDPIVNYLLRKGKEAEVEHQGTQNALHEVRTRLQVLEEYSVELRGQIKGYAADLTNRVKEIKSNGKVPPEPPPAEPKKARAKKTRSKKTSAEA